MAKLAFDTGGTFTDFALLDDRGELHLHKVLSTPKNPAEAVVQGVTELLERFGDVIVIEELQVLGATTVVTNAVLERKGVETGFITTDGFQDMLRIRNEGRYDLYDLNIKYPDPLVTRPTASASTSASPPSGDVVTELEEETVREIAGQARGRRASARSPSACCTPTSIRSTSGASRRSCERRHPTSSCRCRRTSARRCASSTAPRRRSSTPTRGRRWPATWPPRSASSASKGIDRPGAVDDVVAAGSCQPPRRRAAGAPDRVRPGGRGGRGGGVRAHRRRGQACCPSTWAARPRSCA